MVAALEILYATGLRVSELLGLSRRALSGDAVMLMVKGKGGKERVVPLSDAARDAAAALVAATPPAKGAKLNPALFAARKSGPVAAVRRNQRHRLGKSCSRRK